MFYMENLTSPVNVQVDARDKKIANSILKSLGLNMSTYVNMAIKQLIIADGIPFELKINKSTKELLEALQEGEDILNGTVNSKGYHDMYELLEDLKK